MLHRLLQNRRGRLLTPLALSVCVLLWAAEPVLAAVACPLPSKSAKPARTGKARKPLTTPQHLSLLSVVLKEQPATEQLAATPSRAPETMTTANNSWGVTPFVGKDTLADPAASNERQTKTVVPGLEPTPQLVAGIACDLGGGASLNLGYTLPTSSWADLAQPMGFTLTDESEQKRISIGIDIPF